MSEQHDRSDGQCLIYLDLFIYAKEIKLIKLLEFLQAVILSELISHNLKINTSKRRTFTDSYIKLRQR